jgi:hypothetical protein
MSGPERNIVLLGEALKTRLVTIVIADYDMIDADWFYHHIFKLYDPEKMVPLADVMEIHTLELRKLPETPGADEREDNRHRPNTAGPGTTEPGPARDDAHAPYSLLWIVVFSIFFFVPRFAFLYPFGYIVNRIVSENVFALFSN